MLCGAGEVVVGDSESFGVVGTRPKWIQEMKIVIDYQKKKVKLQY